MFWYIISYHLDVICFSEQIVWHVHMCMCVFKCTFVPMFSFVNLLWQAAFPCYNKEHELDLNLKSNYCSHAFIIGLAGNRLQGVSVCFKATPNYFHMKIQLLSCEHTGEHSLLGREFVQGLCKLLFPTEALTIQHQWISIPHGPRAGLPQWWSLNPRHFQWVWHLPGLRDHHAAPVEWHFLGSLWSLWRVHVWTGYEGFLSSHKTMTY